MTPPFLSRNLYIFLFSLLGIVYIIGLFVPLMDNDSAHHANIALRMHLTGDYVNLVDYGKDYLDKPHLHFWLCAISYKIFSVTTFAYKLPSLLFTIAGTYSSYRLGKALYNKEAGKLTALIIASSFSYILANNDVRMDAILTASVALTTWQLVEFIQHKNLRNIVGAALGFALGFATKGHIAIFVPAIAALFYILYLKQWELLYTWKWLLLIILFAFFVSPVVYCYYLQYNLHPEKIVRGKDHINGVGFILLNQSIERFSGEMGTGSKNDYFFFIHSFLWAFAPWSILSYVAIAGRIKSFFQRREEWLTTGVFLIMLIIVSLSNFKLPHYLNIIFPFTAVIASAFILNRRGEKKWVRIIYYLQLSLSLLLLLVAAIINFWAFPVENYRVMVLVVVILSVFFYFIKSTTLNSLQKAITMSVSSISLCFLLLNANFYPQLLRYQGGNELAEITKEKVKPEDVYFWKETYSSSYNFYTSSMRNPFTDSSIKKDKKTWLLYDKKSEEEIKNAGLILGEKFETSDYEITMPTFKFINPATRKKACTTMVIAEIQKK